MQLSWVGYGRNGNRSAEIEFLLCWTSCFVMRSMGSSAHHFVLAADSEGWQMCCEARVVSIVDECGESRGAWSLLYM